MQSPKLPPEVAQMKAPDAGAVRTATGRRTMDMVRNGMNTILTSGSGVNIFAPTEKKTLLGQ
jgi:hypothetical protein